jgi:hypothetical protein
MCILAFGDDPMPLKDSMQSEQTGNDQASLREETNPQEASVEEIETSIEVSVQAQAKHEFETQRQIPDACTKAIVSVNGKDVDEVPLAAHERAA